MGSILQPYSNLLNPGQYQVPTGALGIDWSNSLTNNLIFCIVPAALDGVDLTGNVAIPLYNNTFSSLPQPHISPDGPGINAAANNGKGYQSFTPISNRFKTWTSLTLMWRGYQLGSGSIGTNTNFAGYIGINYNFPATAPFNIAIMGQDNSNPPGFQHAWNNAGSQATLNQTMVATSGMYTFTVTFLPGSGTNVVFYINGVQGNSTFFGTGPVNSTSTSYIFFSNGGTGGVSNLGAIWDRVLSPTEIMAMHLNPYQFLIADEYEMPALLQPAPPVFTLMPQIVM